MYVCIYICMYVRIYVYMNIDIYMCTYTYTYMYIHGHISVCVIIFTHFHILMCVLACVCVWMCVVCHGLSRVCVNACACACARACVYVVRTSVLVCVRIRFASIGAKIDWTCVFGVRVCGCTWMHVCLNVCVTWERRERVCVRGGIERCQVLCNILYISYLVRWLRFQCEISWLIVTTPWLYFMNLETRGVISSNRLTW